LNNSSTQQTLISFQWSFIEKFGKVIFQLAQIIVLTRFLTKDDFGIVALALVSIEFSYLFVDAGLNAGILYLQNASQRALSSVFWLNLGLAMILYGLLWLISPFLAHFYEEAILSSLIPLLGVNILLLAIGRQHRTYLQKNFNFKAIALTEILAYALALILAIVLATEGYGVYSLIYSTLLASLISNVSYLFLRIKKEPITLEFGWQEVKPFIDLGKFQMGSRLLDFVSKETDIFIIGKMLGLEVLGLYSLTKQLVLRLFNVINPIITNVLSPWLASLQADKEKQASTYLNITRYLAYLNFPLYLILATGSFELLYVIYGPTYASGALLLFTLTIYYSILSITNPVGSLQIATGRTDVGFYWTVFRASLTPLALYIGIQINGIQGVAWILLGLSIGLLYPLWWLQIRTMISVSFKNYLNQFYRPLLSYLLLGATAHFAIKPLFNQPNYIATICIIIVALFIQVGGIFIYDRTFLNTVKTFWAK
jgi:O-antigen/teichoic acid export membrane protein